MLVHNSCDGFGDNPFNRKAKSFGEEYTSTTGKMNANGYETSYGKSSPNLTKPKGWKVGDPIDNLTKAGNEPSWSTVRSRYWKNKAYYYADDYLESDLIRMRKGQAPLHSKYNVPMELHHKNGRNIANPHSIENLQEVWPWEHDLIDEFRHYTGPKPEGY